MNDEGPNIVTATGIGTGTGPGRTATPDDARVHRQAWDLIPWVLAGGAGGASAAERQLVEDHCRVCPDCHDELAFHRRLHGAMQGDGQATPQAAAAADAGLRRLMARIDADAASAHAPVSATPAQGRGNGNGNGTLVRWLAAAVVVQAVGLVGLAALLGRADGPAADYTTLSDGSGDVDGKAAAHIRLVVDGSMSTAELGTLLATHGLRIVESRAEPGVFGLAGSAGTVPAEATLQALRATPGVRLAEPLGSLRVGPVP